MNFMRKDLKLENLPKEFAHVLLKAMEEKNIKTTLSDFLVYSLASCDETNLHLEFVNKSGYIGDELYQSLSRENDELGRKINKFIKFVETDWK